MVESIFLLRLLYYFNLMLRGCNNVFSCIFNKLSQDSSVCDTWLFSPLRSSLEMERMVTPYEGELVSQLLLCHSKSNFYDCTLYSLHHDT